MLGSRHSSIAVSRQSKIGRVDRPRQSILVTGYPRSENCPLAFMVLDVCRILNQTWFDLPINLVLTHMGVRVDLRLYYRAVTRRSCRRAAGVRPCRLDGRSHLGLSAWHPGLNPTRKPHEPCLWSRLSGRPKVSLLHSACGSRPTRTTTRSGSCGRPSLLSGRSIAPWVIRMAPGPQPDAQAA